MTRTCWAQKLLSLRRQLQQPAVSMYCINRSVCPPASSQAIGTSNAPTVAAGLAEYHHVHHINEVDWELGSRDNSVKERASAGKHAAMAIQISNNLRRLVPRHKAPTQDQLHNPSSIWFHQNCKPVLFLHAEKNT